MYKTYYTTLFEIITKTNVIVSKIVQKNIPKNLDEIEENASVSC